MSITYGDVRSWRAAPLGQAADGIKQDLDALEKSRDQLEDQAVPDSWDGWGRLMAEIRRGALVSAMDEHLEGKRTLQRALYDAETLVTEIERLREDVEGDARTQEFTIGSDGSVTDATTPPTFHSRWEAEEWSRIRTEQAQGIADDITTILGRAAAADATIAEGIPAGGVDYLDERGTVAPEVAERWATLSDDERRAIIEELIEEKADEAGIPDPDIVWEPESWGSNGETRDGGGEIALNEGLLDNPAILNTVAHEMRHARQIEAIDDENDNVHWPWDDPFAMHEEDGISEEQADEWDENYDDYKSTSSGDSYEDYYNQPVEADARESGKDYYDGLSGDELERLLEEGLA